MNPSLKHSIYLQEVPMVAEESGGPFNKTEQIMKQPEGHLGINETARKRSYNYQTFEKTFMSGFQTRQTAPRDSPHKIEESDFFKKSQQVQKGKKEPVKRYCNGAFHHILEQYQQCVPPKVDPKQREKRNKLANQAKNRKKEQIEKFKQNLAKRIKFETKQDEESSIEAEIYVDPEQKYKKIDQFLKRQQYMEQERSILREMREFCMYGAIKIKNNT